MKKRKRSVTLRTVPSGMNGLNGPCVPRHVEVGFEARFENVWFQSLGTRLVSSVVFLQASHDVGKPANP